VVAVAVAVVVAAAEAGAAEVALVPAGALGGAAAGAGAVAAGAVAAGAVAAGAVAAGAAWVTLAGPRALLGRLVFGLWLARGGASPWITGSGWDGRPIRCAASWLTDHVSATVTAIPSSAATAHRKPRQVRVMTFAP
jgi:hypothetical protein